ncbi:MAG: hypothetical protein AAGL90_16720 [Pseudomonadota bacterium]
MTASHLARLADVLNQVRESPHRIKLTMAGLECAREPGVDFSSRFDEMLNLPGWKALPNS